ncbi:MAG TPA: hypothetical protein VGL46_14175 [Pseudonocardiaceae bacterium]
MGVLVPRVQVCRGEQVTGVRGAAANRAYTRRPGGGGCDPEASQAEALVLLRLIGRQGRDL